MTHTIWRRRLGPFSVERVFNAVLLGLKVGRFYIQLEIVYFNSH